MQAARRPASRGTCARRSIGRARGTTIRTREDFLLDVLIDGKKAATSTLTCLNGSQGMAGGFAGWLSAGSHTLRIWNHNLLARRSLQLDSLKIFKPSGSGSYGDGLPDWIYQFLATRNGSTSIPSCSYTSPVCLEGYTRNVEAATFPSITEHPFHFKKVLIESGMSMHLSARHCLLHRFHCVMKTIFSRITLMSHGCVTIFLR